MIRMQRLMTASIIAASIAAGTLGTILFADGPATAPAVDVRAQAKVLVEKAKDLFQNDKLLEAKTTNDAALKLAPDLLDAKVLQQRINLRISEMAGPTAPGTVTTPGAATQASGGAIDPISEKLTPQQINRMRAYETTTADKDLKGTVDQKTLGDFWKEVVLNDPTKRNLDAKDREAFLTGSFADQVLMFKDSGRNDYIDKLKITGDPVAMDRFSREINTWVVNNCTTTAGCHAMDTSTSKFRIYTKGGATAANVYTNFYIMSKVTVGNNALIDRQRPDSSLVGQFGLSPKDAIVSHPTTRVKVLPKFTGIKDPAYNKLIDAISTLSKFAPSYGFDTPPAATTTAPAPK